MGVPSHWLRGNASEWTPANVAFFDTETVSCTQGDRQTLSLRLWVAGVVNRKSGTASSLSVRTAHGTDRASLAGWLDGATTGHQTTWCYAHNLGFDLTVSRLPDYLHRLGWQMTGWQFAGRNVGGRMAKRSKRLTLADSVSLLPHNLGEVGRAVGRLKAPMPPAEAPQEDWLAYCTQDVLVLAQAVLELMDWWDGQRLGHWTQSGPALGWNAWRHRAGDGAILVNHDPPGPEADRPAIYGGRRDVTRVGEVAGGPFALVDFSNAYLTVAANCLLPTRRRGFYDRMGPVLEKPTLNAVGALAHCEVNTPVPAYPYRTAHGVFYPTGQFETVLTSPEIQAAREAGHLVHIGRGWLHDLGYPLSEWAEWCLALLRSDDDSTAPVVKMMAKQWGRSVVGKFAARSSRVEDFGPALWPSWHLERGSTGPDHRPAAEVHIAGRHWRYLFDQEGENAYPAVLAWVEAYTRVALNRMLQALGEDLWVCCDTDGCVLDLTQARSWLRSQGLGLGRIRGPLTVAEAVCDAVRDACWPLVPRVKVLSETLTVSGPQHYAGDTFERAAGRPGKPEVDADGSLHWWRWPRVGWQMTNGSRDGFVRVEGKWTAPTQLAHRWVLEDGSTVPVRATVGEFGESRLSPWQSMLESMGENRLHRSQSTALNGLY